MRTALTLALLLAIAGPASAETPTSDMPADLRAAIERKRKELEAQLKEAVGTDEVRTDPGTWSAGGWDTLRWGMGYLDVIDAVDGEVVKSGPRADGSYRFVFKSSRAIYRQRILVGAKFEKNKLCEVVLIPDNEDPAARSIWVEQAREGLRIKYGKPIGDSVKAPWLLIDDDTRIFAIPANGMIQYSDIAHLARTLVEARESEADKL